MRGYSASAGFGLIELMVAMTLALILSAATLTLYLNMSRSNSELAKTNSQMEHGRLAIRLLRDDLTWLLCRSNPVQRQEMLRLRDAFV